MEVTRILAERSLRKTRVAAYVRVSTLQDTQEESYEAQAEYYERFIRKNPDWDFAGVYGDRISGTHSENRPEFNRMVEDAIDRKIDLIYCKSVSRWARNIVDALETIKYLHGNHVDIIFEQENLDTRIPNVILRLSLSAAVAQSESESISENLKWLYRNRAEQGIYKPVKGVNFGYNTDNNTFKPDENAKYVKRIFRRFAEGAEVTEIAEELAGVADPYGRPITARRVQAILKNEIYVGDKHFGKRPQVNVITKKPDEVQVENYVKDHHEGLISRELWDAVQERFEGEKKAKDEVKKNCRKMACIMNAAPKMKTKAIAERMGITPEEARRVRDKLRRMKVIQRIDGQLVVDMKKMREKCGAE